MTRALSPKGLKVDTAFSSNLSLVNFGENKNYNTYL
uniref:Uncharacterized protein n=1 Tax=Vitis vinifera TaxID=29760 RepID=F6HZI5_VITVI